VGDGGLVEPVERCPKVFKAAKRNLLSHGQLISSFTFLPPADEAPPGLSHTPDC
jgi:hypothetical protein